MRYGVQYQPDSGIIVAGSVRRDPVTGVDKFILKSDVSGFAIGAVALWLLGHDDGEPYRITDRHGTTYELTCKIVEE